MFNISSICLNDTVFLSPICESGLAGVGCIGVLVRSTAACMFASKYEILGHGVIEGNNPIV